MKLVNILIRNRNNSVRTIIFNKIIMILKSGSRFKRFVLIIILFLFFCYNFITIIYTLNGHIKRVYDTIKILIYFSIYRP